MEESLQVSYNYDALLKNAKALKAKIGDAKLCAVVKCDAYGHGLIRTASYLAGIADCFAVASVVEADAIKHLGTDTLILLPQDVAATKCAVKSGYILTVDSFDTLAIIDSVTRELNAPCRVHVKFDTGMHRLGFYVGEAEEVAERLKNTKCVVEGVFSHFSSADIDRQFTEKQYEKFLCCCEVMQHHFGRLTRHIANTAAVFLGSKFALDLVRCGLGLYGYGGEGLSVVKIVRARVMSLKSALEGATVSYENSYTCKSDKKLAVIDIGYANGLLRNMSGNACVFYADKRLEIVGKICMGMSVVDVTGVDIAVGDRVEVLGDNLNLAKYSGQSIYELLLSLR
jgi:alanine racemase